MENNRLNAATGASEPILSVQPQPPTTRCPPQSIPVNPADDFTQEPDPIKVSTDWKQYKRIKLNNGCRVVLISEIPTTNSQAAQMDTFRYPEFGRSDPSMLEFEIMPDFVWHAVPVLTTSEAGPSNSPVAIGSLACAVAVSAGDLDVQPKYPGSAHLLEHLVFTEEFSDLVAHVGGHTNATTDADTTHYYFTTRHTDEGDIDAMIGNFAELFKKLDISVEDVQTEVDVLEFEYRRLPVNIANRRDMLRAWWKKNAHEADNQVWYHSGNRQWLSQSTPEGWEDLANALRTFYATNYCANNMAVVLQGRLGLETLQKIAIKHFGNLKTGPFVENIIQEEYKDPYKNESFCSNIYYLKPSPSEDFLYMSWALEACMWKELYKTKPYEYIGKIIASSIEGGLVDVLIKRKLILGLKCGPELQFKTRYGVVFTIKMEMTQYGIEQQNQVFGLVFSYIEKIKQDGVLESIYENQKHLLEENLKADTLTRSASDNVQLVAVSIFYHEPQDVLRGPIEFLQFMREPIIQVLDALTAHTVNITLITNEFGQLTFPNKFPHMEFQHRQIATSHATRAKWTAEVEFQLPTLVNPFYNEIIFSSESFPIAVGMKDILKACNGFSSEWEQKRLITPVTSFRCEIQGQRGSSLATCRGMLGIFCHALDLVVHTATEMGAEALVETSVNVHLHGSIWVDVTGFDLAAESVFTHIVQAIIGNGSWNQITGHFASVKEKMLRNCDRILNNPEYHANDLLEQGVMIGHSSIQEVQSAICQAEVDDFEEFMAAYFASPCILLGIYGNARREAAQRVTEIVSKIGCIQQPYLRLPLLVLPKGRFIHQVYSLKKTSLMSHLKLWIPLDGTDKTEHDVLVALISLLRQKLFGLVRYVPLGYTSNVALTQRNDQYAIELDVSYDPTVEHKDDMICIIDTLLQEFYDFDFANMTQETLEELLDLHPVASRLWGVPPDVITKIAKEHLNPMEKEKFRGLYVQVICDPEESQKNYCWDAYRRPQTVTAVDQSSRDENVGDATYVTDLTAFNTNGTSLS